MKKLRVYFWVLTFSFLILVFWSLFFFFKHTNHQFTEALRDALTKKERRREWRERGNIGKSLFDPLQRKNKYSKVVTGKRRTWSVGVALRVFFIRNWRVPPVRKKRCDSLLILLPTLESSAFFSCLLARKPKTQKCTRILTPPSLWFIQFESRSASYCQSVVASQTNPYRSVFLRYHSVDT